MKRKIFAVLFAVVLCLGVSFSSLRVVSFAEGFSWIDIISGFFSVANYFIEEETKYKDDVTYESNYCVRIRAEILEKFGSFRSGLPSDLTKEQFDQLLQMWSLGDIDDIRSQYGAEVSIFCDSNRSDYLDFEKLYLSRFFRGRSDFVNQLFDRDLSNYTVDDNGNVQIPVSDLKNELTFQNNTLTPKNRTMYKYSWRDLSDTQQNYKGDYLARAVGKNGKFIDDTSYDDGIYIQPYAILGDVEDNNGKNCRGEYYSPYQYRLYCVKSAAPVDSGYEFEYQWKIDALFYQIDEDERLDVQTVDLVSWYVDYPYITLGFGRSSYYKSLLSFWFYDDYNSVVNSPFTPFYESFGDISSASFYSSVYENFLLSTDTSVSYKYNHFLAYIKNADFTDTTAYTTTTLSQFQEYDLNDNVSDYGLLVSNTPFSTTYLFDITRLPNNATVTISGDSVYDYSITDNSTGDTSTIYNYVTNNYNYPDNSGNTSDGGNGGDIITGGLTVGGHVDVGGKVDINVNINGGGNGDNYSMPDTSGMNDYLESALDDSSGFRKFLKEFFDFLPPPILAFLGVALTCAIIARLLGR